MLNAQKTATSLSVFIVAVHIVWSIIVALGWGQALLDFIAMLHFIENPPHVGLFNIGTAVILWIVAGIVGYIIGFVFATMWNKVHAR